MKNSARNGIVSWTRRVMAGLLCLSILWGLAPSVAAPAAAAEPEDWEYWEELEELEDEPAAGGHWAQPYLDTLVDWGVMRGDLEGNLNPDNSITRAEFVTMVNRAYGYDQVGSSPFTDLVNKDGKDEWYADDFSIAYNVGYIQGTSPRTASPNLTLTREQAVVALGRNMMLKPTTGETLGFSDTRDLADWSRGMVEPAVEAGIITGNPDGTFAPQRNITRGEVACMLVRAIGQPIQEPGEYSLGGVFGNVTITTAGVALRDTVIAGDLYLTGGIGLGDVLLENVTVLGKIVDSGAGESEKGQSSIVLRNVTAEEMVVDSINNQFVTVRSEGNTSVGTASIRTPAYLEDATAVGYGLKLIELDGENGTSIQLAGNVKEVVNRTPRSTLIFAQGTAEKVTVDERATGSTVSIENGARIKDLNLDVGTRVTGSGDVDSLTVSANGVTTTMLPDEVTIRPGVTASIAGETMDNVSAKETTEDPRLLAGYPAVRNIAPKSASLVFSTNKRGIIYWAVTNLADGSADVEDVISPPSYSTNIIASNKINATGSQTEYTASVSKLTSDGSYYVTAVLVDSRGERSPVKVTAFTTPDDSTPAFGSGYPVMTQITDHSAQVTVLTTKSCQLYYALLPKGSTAPKAADFKAGAISGNLGYGTVNAVKNNTIPITVNHFDLEELTSYDLYLWLTDYDGAKSMSSPKKITFTTVDGTPPVVTNIRQTDAKAKAVTISFSMSEPGTLYWVVVKEGDSFFRALTTGGAVPEMTDEAAKAQVEAGVGAVKKGNKSASKADTDYTFSISGLTAETTYDLYYVAKDKAGNYSASVVKLSPVSTLDNNPPTVTQQFTRYNGTNTNAPLADTDIRLVFSESIQGVETVAGRPNYVDLLGLYQAVEDAVLLGSARPEAIQQQREARDALADGLRKFIKFYQISSVDGTNQVSERNSAKEVDPSWDPEDWVIDYRYATVVLEDGKTVITFPTAARSSESALKLSSGATYRFELSGIADTSLNNNRMGNTRMDQFTTVFATVNLTEGADSGIVEKKDADGNVTGTETVEFDMAFKVTPISTANVENTVMWDILLWSDSVVEFELYRRKEGETFWTKATAPGTIQPTVHDKEPGTSVQGTLFRPVGATRPDFDKLKEFVAPVEYGIRVTKLNGDGVRDTWSQSVDIRVSVVAGDRSTLQNMAENVNEKNFKEQTANGMREINLPENYVVSRIFRDAAPPTFTGGYPRFDPGDSGVDFEVQLSRGNSYYYYVIAPVEVIPTSYPVDGFGPGDVYDPKAPSVSINKDNWSALKENGVLFSGKKDTEVPVASLPTSNAVMNPTYSNPQIKTGSGSYSGGTDVISVTGLTDETKYIAYFVLKGESQDSFSQVYCFRFETTKVVRPVLSINITNPTAVLSSDLSAEVDCLLVTVGMENELFRKKMGDADVWVDNTTYPAGTNETTYKGYTLLEAMQASVIPAGQTTAVGSVFDLYASQTVKDLAANLVRTQGGADSSSVPVGHYSLRGNNATQNVNCLSYMSGTARYWIVIVGRSPLGSTDAFRANKELSVPDTTPPRVLTVSTSVSGIKNMKNEDIGEFATSYASAMALKYSGSMTVTFDEELYYKRDDNTWLAVVDMKPTVASGWASSDSVISNLQNVFKHEYAVAENTAEANYPECYSLRFTFKDITEGAEITFHRNLCDSGGHTGTVALTLRMKLVQQNGVWVPTFEVTPTSWISPNAK